MDLTYIMKVFDEEEIVKILLENRERVKRISLVLNEDPECPQEVKDHLQALMMIHSDPLDLANKPTTTPDVLKVLAKSKNKYVRMFTGQNPNCPREELWELSNDPEIIVLVGVAKNNKCSEDIALDLAKKQIEDVSMALAGNINVTSEAIFKELKKSKSKHVQKALRENPNYPECYFN